MAKDFVIPHIPDRMYFKIGEVCKISGIKPYILRYWETEFDILLTSKSKANQRMYERKDIENILLIKKLLWQDRYSIEGAKKRLKELKQEKRATRLQEEKSDSSIKLSQVKDELKDLIRYIRSN